MASLYKRWPGKQASGTGCCCCNTVLQAAVQLSVTLGRECSEVEEKRGEVLVKIVLQVAELILCLLVHALVQLLPHRLVFGKGFVRVILCHLRAFCLTGLSLCLQCIASGFGEDAVRLDRRHLLVG